MKHIKLFFKRLFCKHNYKVVYSHDNILSFHECTICEDKFTIDSRSCR